MATYVKDSAAPMRPMASAALQLRRILCPLDFSELSARALDRATQLACASGAEIQALFVFPIGPLPARGPDHPAQTADAGARATVARDAERFLHPAREAGAQVRFSQSAGDAAAEILSAAAAWPADLIVMGTHGRGGLERWILGSVAQAVLRNARCPVLTVGSARRDEHAAVARDGGGIVCALENGETSERTLAHALALSRATGGEVTLVHVLENLSQYQAAALCARVDWPAFCHEIEREARERLLRAAEAAGGGIKDVVVATGKPYREILRLADERDAAAIVMGIHGRASWHLRLFGSNAEHVVREATCPVLTVRGA
jgi:nucleotide-binding universal stress UspA family protein